MAYDSEFIRTIWPVVGYLADRKHVEILLFVVLELLLGSKYMATNLGMTFLEKKKKRQERFEPLKQLILCRQKIKS